MVLCINIWPLLSELCVKWCFVELGRSMLGMFECRCALLMAKLPEDMSVQLQLVFSELISLRQEGRQDQEWMNEGELVMKLLRNFDVVLTQ
jgi:hypothetical protein